MVAKKLIGEDLFMTNWEKARKQIGERRKERKSAMDTKAVADPEEFSRLKIRKQEKERKRRKRVLEERKMVKPGTQSKKKKFNIVEKL